MSEYTDSKSAQIAILAVQSFLVIFNIAGNFMVCVIILRNQDMRTSMNFLLINLAVADMTVAVFFAPQHIFIHTFTHPDGVTGAVLCALLTAGNLAWVGAAASVFTLVCTAIERYFAVIYPLGNKGKLTKRKLKVIITSSWIFGVTVTIPDFLSFFFDKAVNSCVTIWPEEWMGKAYSMAWFLLVAFLPVASMAALYSRVVYTLWFKRTELNENNILQQGVMKVRKRVTLMVIIVSIVFGVCWLTNTANYVLYDYFPSHTFLSYAATNTMILFNSAINPIVYALVNTRFKQKLKAMLCCTFRRVHLARGSQKMEVDIDPAQPTQETGENYRE